uniref:Uncharacterized protein n=1 Tax=Cyprinus carpio TaxID=7962 RepID=A0A8C1S7Y9_CYPCA
MPFQPIIFSGRFFGASLAETNYINLCSITKSCFSLFLQHFQAVSGSFMGSPYNSSTSLQTSTSNLNTSFPRPVEQEEEGKFSSDAIWLWVAIITTIGNIVVVAVVCACAF